MPHDPPEGSPVTPLRSLPLLLAGLAAALLLTLHEISELSGQVLSSDNRIHPFSTLTGPGRLLDWSTDGWQARYVGLAADRIDALAVVHTLFDVVFMVTYVALGRTLLPIGAWRARGLLTLILLADVVEDALAGLRWWVPSLGAGPDADGPAGTMPLLLTIATVTKWVLVLLFVGSLLDPLLHPPAGSRARAAVRHGTWALWHIRYSLAAILPLAVLSVLPGSDVLDQLPDVQRRWAESRQGALHAALAGLSVAVLVVSVFVLGRLHADRLWRRRLRPGVPGYDPTRGLPVLFWLVPALAILPAWWLDRAGSVVAGRHLVAFVAVPVGILVVSGLLTLIAATVTDEPSGRDGAGTPQAGRRPWTARRPAGLARLVGGTTVRPGRAAEEVRTAIVVGDVAAVVAATLTGLGLIRSMTAPTVLHLLQPWMLAPGETLSVAELRAGWLSLGLWGFGVCAVVVATEVGPRMITWLDGHALRPRPRALWRRPVHHLAVTCRPGEPAHPRALGRHDVRGAAQRGGFLGASLLGLGVLGVLPAGAARYLGVVGCLVLGVTAVVVVVGVAVVNAQDARPPALLRVMGFRTTPVLLLLVATYAAATTTTGDPDVHGIRRLPGEAHRESVEQSFVRWLDLPSTDCRTVRPVGAGVTSRDVVVRPMLLVAAEGGGIRAAYWTAAAIDELTSGSRCAQHAPFLSTGASGGAVGLSLASLGPTGTRAPTARGRAAAIARPQALAAGGLGLLVRDPTYSLSGIPLPVLAAQDVLAAGGGPDANPYTWRDRAAVIEQMWEQQVGTAFADPFVPDPAAAWPRTGRLVLNTTMVSTGCRALVSQVRLEPPRAGARCDLPSSQGAAYSFDLLSAYSPQPGAPRGTGPDDRCVGQLRRSTAALLASRFPVVTPSGVVGPCAGPAHQFVDGGYTDNSALGTQLDLARSWLPLVQANNVSVLAGGRGLLDRHSPAPPQLVVPTIVWLTNGDATDAAPDPGSPTAEVAVPLVALSHGGGAQIGVPALLQRAHQLLTPEALCPAGTPVPVCDALRTAIDGRSGVAVVYPATRPAVAAPLGWSLSEASMRHMDRAIRWQAETGCTSAPAPKPFFDAGTDPEPRPVVCALGYRTLADVSAALGAR